MFMTTNAVAATVAPSPGKPTNFGFHIFRIFLPLKKRSNVFSFEIFSSDFKLRGRVVKYYFRVAHGHGFDSKARQGTKE